MPIPPKPIQADRSPRDRPLQRLAGAVLIQALQDATSGPRRYREDALEWINGKQTAGFTFEFCCAILNRDPEDVRQRLMKHNMIPRWDPSDPTFGGAYPGYNHPYPQHQQEQPFSSPLYR